MSIRISFLSAMLVLSPAVAHADCDEAERIRISEEARKLAAKNAWPGVERAFTQLLDSKCSLTFDDYKLGAESARTLGKTLERYERLQAARKIDQRSELIETLAAMDDKYGRVEIKGDPRRPPTLTRVAMPFAPDERKSIEYAMEVTAATGAFRGMLPRGEYAASSKAFVVEPGKEWQVIEVSKSEVDRDSDQPLIRYVNVVALAGPNFLTSGEPTEAIEFSDGQQQFAPEGFFSTGLALQLGAEAGLTYRAPDAGLAVTFGYSGGYGEHTMHTVSGWLAGVLRPGDWRFAAGPQYSVISGSGTGLASWFEVGQDRDRDPTDGIRYQGVSWGGGLAASAGYGVLDFEKLTGVVELGGSWQSDGARSYTAFGLRVGIAPTVPRFKG